MTDLYSPCGIISGSASGVQQYCCTVRYRCTDDVLLCDSLLDETRVQVQFFYFSFLVSSYSSTLSHTSSFRPENFLAVTK